MFGKDLETLEKVAQAVEAAVRKVPGERAYAERVAGGYYVDIVPRRDQLWGARYASPSTWCRT